MKKLSITLCLLFVTIFTSGCNQYFKATQNDVVYYGAYNRRDFVHADVKLFQANSDVFCDGMIFINAPSRAITMKNDLVDAKMLLSCSNGRLVDSNLMFRKASYDKLSGDGYDQLNNKYKFEEIKKSEFKNNSGINKIQFFNDKANSLIKY